MIIIIIVLLIIIIMTTVYVAGLLLVASKLGLCGSDDVDLIRVSHLYITYLTCITSYLHSGTFVNITLTKTIVLNYQDYILSKH